MSANCFASTGAGFTGKARAITRFGSAPITERYFTVDGKIKLRHSANEVLKQAGAGKKF
jgi:hypothetical protein